MNDTLVQVKINSTSEVEGIKNKFHSLSFQTPRQKKNQQLANPETYE